MNYNFQFPFEGKTFTAYVIDGFVTCTHPLFQSFFFGKSVIPITLKLHGEGADKFEGLPDYKVLCFRMFKYFEKKLNKDVYKNFIIVQVLSHATA